MSLYCMGQAVKHIKPSSVEMLTLRLALTDYMKDGRGFLDVIEKRNEDDGT